MHVAFGFSLLCSQEVEVAFGFGNLGVERGDGAVELSVFCISIQPGGAEVIVFFFRNHVFAVEPVLPFEPFAEHIDFGTCGGGVGSGLFKEQALPVDVFFEAFDLLLVGVVPGIVAQSLDGG